MLNLGSMRARLVAVLLASFIATSASATVQSAAPESPGTALSRHIRILAGNPRDFNSLIGAGKAALELGDVQTAAGFFGRAEEVNPNAPAAKAGLGAAMAHMGDADGAIFYFDQATRLGASALTIALDRGLARDLDGDLAAAQTDYRLAIASLNSDEARRRLALSLAIGRDRTGAMTAIQPLLNRRDPAAQRTRAFILALVGDSKGAAQAIEAVMPGGSARFAPFITYLPQLSVQEKAAAVHLGMFPDNASMRISQAQGGPAPASVPPQSRSAMAAPPASVTPPPAQAAPPVRVAVRNSVPPAPRPSFSLPSQGPSASPSFSLPSASSAAPTAEKLAQPEAEPEVTEPEVIAPVVAQADGESSLQEVGDSTDDSKLSSIDKLLAAIEEPPPPAPSPKVEKTTSADAATDKATAAKKAADKKAADKKAAEKKARDAKLAAEKKEREEAAKLGVKGTYWVQLAGGSNQDRMANEYKKLSAKAGTLLKTRPGYVTAGKEYFRLVIGPFDTKSESQAFVNKLAKEGVGGFSWTRTPSQIKIEKLSSR